MIVAIHQPNYIPWLGYFYKIYLCDIFVYLDDVPYTKNSIINRNKLKTAQGAAWLTVDVLSKGRYGQLIKDVEINNNVPWSKNHWKTISQNYAKAPYFTEYRSFFEQIYLKRWERLADLNESLIGATCQLLGLRNAKFVKSSSLEVSGASTQLLVNICKVVGADTYLAGFGSKKYMDEAAFEKASLKFRYSDFKRPTYRQLWGDFIPDLSIIDLLFNEGERSLEILKG